MIWEEEEFLWHGPLVYAGDLQAIEHGLPGNIHALDILRVSPDDLQQLPAAVVVDGTTLTSDERAEVQRRLRVLYGRLPCEIPFIFLCDDRLLWQEAFRPQTILDARIPRDLLLQRIRFVQRFIVRIEEARIRRRVLGRIASYGTAPHFTGASGLLVIGRGRRFLEVENIDHHAVEVIGAFTGNMGETYLANRAFDAVILDEDSYESGFEIDKLRRDPRFATLPVLAFASDEDDLPALFRSGLSDVIAGDPTRENLSMRIASAVRIGKRRRLSDRVLTASRAWLLQTSLRGGISQELYQAYCARLTAAMAPRGIQVCELSLEDGSCSADKRQTVLSLADAINREDDLACSIEGKNTVAVVKSQSAADKLKSRIEAILDQTRL